MVYEVLYNQTINIGSWRYNIAYILETPIQTGACSLRVVAILLDTGFTETQNTQNSGLLSKSKSSILLGIEDHFMGNQLQGHQRYDG